MEMNKVKKLVSILLAAVLVFGVAATGFAAAPEDVVLTEVTADAAAAPEDAPVVEEQPVAEAAAEEPAADVQAVTTTTTITVTDSGSTPIPNATVMLSVDQAAGTGKSLMAGNVELTTAFQAFATKTGSDGKVAVTFVASGTDIEATKVIAKVAKSEGALVYNESNTVDIAITNGSPASTAAVKLTGAASAIGFKGTVSGTVKEGSTPVAGLKLVLTPVSTSGSDLTPMNLTTDRDGKYSAVFDGVSNAAVDYKLALAASEKAYGMTAGGTVVIPLTTDGIVTNDVTVAKVNTVTVKDATTNAPIEGIKVVATETTSGKVFNALTDANGVALFEGISASDTIAFEAGGKARNGNYYFMDSKSGISTSASNTFPAQSMELDVAPALSAMNVSIPANYLAVDGAAEIITATFSATGYPDLKADSDFVFQWQYKSGSNWIDINEGQTLNGGVHANVATKSLTITNATADLNDKQYRVVAYPANAGYTQADAEKVAQCYSATTFTVATGKTVDGNVYNSATGQPITFTSGTAKVNVWNAADYDADPSASPVKTVALQSGANNLAQTTLPPGTYVMGIAPSSGINYTSLETTNGSAYFNTYGGVIRFTVSDKNVTNLALYLDPTPAVVFTQQPQSKTVILGETSTFGAVAYNCTGATKALMTNGEFQWQVNDGSGTFANISGATNASYITPKVTKEMNGWQYRVIASTPKGAVTSNVVTLSTGTPTPIAIINNPQDTSVPAGTAAEFTVGIAGTAAPTYQWQVDTGKGFTNITVGGMYKTVPVRADLSKGILAGQKLTIEKNYVTSAISGYKYRVIVEDKENDKKFESSAATLTIVPATPLSVKTQPVDTTAALNGMAVFNVVIDGTANFNTTTYQWQVSTDKGLSFSNITPADVMFPVVNNITNYKDCTAYIAVTSSTMKGNMYRVLVTDGTSTIASSAATLTDVVNAVAPTVAVQPTDQSVAINRKAEFKFEAAGTGPFKYAKQTSTDGGKTWSPTDSTLKSTALTDGTTWKTTPSFEEIPTALTQSGTMYKFAVRQWASVSTAGAMAFTVPVKLTVTEVIKPTITEQPKSQSAVIGESATFSVQVEGTAPFGYIWEKSTNGFVWNVVGAEATYTTPALTDEDDLTFYRVRVFNGEEDYVVSEAATLTVTQAVTSAKIVGEDGVYIGESSRFKVEVEPVGAAFETEWFIADSNAAKASIDAGGVLTAKGQGIIKVYAKITCANGEVITVSKKVSILKATTSFGLKSKENRTTLYKGGDGSTKYPWHTQLVLTNVKPSGASSSVKNMIWTSSNPKIATVENGKVKVAKGAGTKLGNVIITATDMGNPDSIATYAIKVTKP